MASELDTPGARLTEARKRQNMTRAELARKMGCAVSAVSNHENGINGIRAPTAALYAETLKVTPQWLLYGDADSPAPARSSSPMTLTQMPNGKARLELNTVLPLSVALQILALVQGDEK